MTAKMFVALASAAVLFAAIGFVTVLVLWSLFTGEALEFSGGHTEAAWLHAVFGTAA